MALGSHRAGALVATLTLVATVLLAAQDTSAVREAHDSLSVRFVATDLRAAVHALGRYLSKPVLVGNFGAMPVTLETPEPVPRSGVAALLKGLVESQGLQFSEDSLFVRIGPRVEAIPKPPDQARAAAAPQLFVVRLKHARSSDVAATVNLLFGGAGEFSPSRGLSGATLSQQLRQNVVPPSGQGEAPPSSPDLGAGARAATLSGPVTIVPDQLTNSLLVRASPQDYSVLQHAVDELDIRPLQVLIEVLIIEVQHTRSFSLGADFTLPPQPLGKGNASSSGQLAGGGLGDLVVRLMSLGHADVDATLRVAASKGDVHIISRPVLLASNNTEAQFLVGSQQPFVQVSRSVPTQTPSFDEVVEYRDVGTKLTVRPTINQDGYVSLLIRQEVSEATSETEFNAPVISTREADTQVLVRDGQTIVLGGLRDHQRMKNQAGIPILSSIPIIGGLFGSATRSASETELYLFLTPRILKSDADADSATAPRLPRSLEQ